MTGTHRGFLARRSVPTPLVHLSKPRTRSSSRPPRMNKGDNSGSGEREQRNKGVTLGATPDNVPGTPTEQPSLTHRRSRSGLDIKFPVSPQPDMLPEYDPHNSSPQTPDLQANLGSSKRRSTTLTDGMDEQTLIDLAREAFVRELGLEDDTILQGGRVEIREVPTGTYLMKEESNKVLTTSLLDDVALVYLISGLLQVSQKMTDNHEEVSMFSAHPGEIVGGLAVLTGEPSFFTIRAKHYSRIALLSKNTFYKLANSPNSLHSRPQNNTNKQFISTFVQLMSAVGCRYSVVDTNRSVLLLSQGPQLVVGTVW
ncbi:unnamed protein product [Timema podura]|uniref:Cyclic nucleotide-binding domain-containing protein n=1 Tax=Timema podura TaxID=61482 RepID=A0ABN7P3V5_TIMPD|nr:unnamed protein product [Timema podura]